MLSKAKQLIVKSLHTKKGRAKHGLCLVEGAKVIETAGDAVEFTFTREDAWAMFDELVTTDTPQEIAGAAKTPQWSLEDVLTKPTVVVLDGVQDPGNVGAMLRLCLGFNASLVLVESVDVTNPKVVRGSVGALFHVPWVNVKREDLAATIAQVARPVYRLELGGEASALASMHAQESITLIIGSEGSGIKTDIPGTSVAIAHNEALESLNVGHALAIALAGRYQS